MGTRCERWVDEVKIISWLISGPVMGGVVNIGVVCYSEKLFQCLPLLLSLWWPVLESVEHIILEQFLVGDPDFHWHARGAVFSIPAHK